MSVKVMNTRNNVSDVHKEIPDKAAKLSSCQLLMTGLWTMEAYTGEHAACTQKHRTWNL